jgi:hypothetical protein
MLLALITNDAWLGIGNLAAAWQLQLQESAVAFECTPIVGRDGADTDAQGLVPSRGDVRRV